MFPANSLLSIIPSFVTSFSIFLFLLHFLHFSAPQNVGICSTCLDGSCPIGFSCINNCCIIPSSSSSSIPSTTSAPSPPQSQCQDKWAPNLCNFYKITGRCLQSGFIVWLMISCKSTCGLCTAQIVSIG
ncbi:hypothetical protein niasHS_013030 [Heterodera schachtii]|uniref:ShKT domain-containing protein n=1 Tax=Heterodera schachtii TaxID=97005 RepID=A0ABD2IPP8_HETSC